MKTGLYALTLATAWARVEGHRHYPADGLAGMALGEYDGNIFYRDLFRIGATAKNARED